LYGVPQKQKLAFSKKKKKVELVSF